MDLSIKSIDILYSFFS